MNKLPWMCILWPSFLAACALEMLVFAWIDPGELKWIHMLDGLSTQGIYSIAFFTFWALTVSSSTMTAWLAGSQMNPSGQ
jgi:hypothetical protein